MKKIILVTGDPNSINSEIIFKCWKNLSNKIKKKIVVISNIKLLQDQFKKLNYKIKIKKIANLSQHSAEKKMQIIDVAVNYKNSFKVSKKASSKFVLNCLNLAHNLATKKEVSGLINCPINKTRLKKGNIGVTEYLASKCRTKKGSEVMIIMNKSLMVSPFTTHVDIKSINKKINKNLIIKKVKIINNWYKKQFKKKPKIAVLGLNPHNAEFKKDSEEEKIIVPALKKLKKNDIKIKGPFASDTMFINNYKNFDIVVGMYHDQVITPFKTLFKFDAINLTLGLKYNRVSPDHGVAIQNILKKKSDYISLLNCFHYIDKFK